MGARTWMAVISDGDVRQALAAGPTLDRAQAGRVAQQLFPKDKLVPQDDGSLAGTALADDELLIGCFPGLTIVAAKEFAIDRPSEMPERFLAHAGSRTVHLHAMHSVVDWLAFAVWQGGTLQRSLSLSPDSGVIEDIGARLPFEAPYWAGAHPADDPEAIEAGESPYPLPFHPLELGEAALQAFFGYQLEGPTASASIDAEAVPLLRFQRKKALFKFW